MNYKNDYYHWPEDNLFEYFQKKVNEFRQARKEFAETGKVPEIPGEQKKKKGTE